jgi:hypothetical protein
MSDFERKVEDAPAHDGDFFQIAEMKWRREMPRIVK